MSSLRPVAGTARAVQSLLADWQQAEAEPEPLVIETSGSTGKPKRVLLSRTAMRASAQATNTRLGGPGQWLLALPVGYVAGTSVVFRSLVAGAEPQVLAEHAGLAEAVAAMTGARRYLSLVPTQLSRMLGLERELSALRELDAVLVGGASLDRRLRKAAALAGVRVVTSYGASETCGGCVYDGVPLDGVGVGLADDGRIRIAGPVLFEGYAEAPQSTARVLRDGWFTTADVGRLDPDGRLEVLGRVDEVVVSGGVKVPTAAVAARLREHEAVRDAAVVGIPDPEWGQRVVAVVAASGDLQLAELREFTARRLPRRWAPSGLVPVAALPRLRNGKVDRRRVEEIAGGQAR